MTPGEAYARAHRAAAKATDPHAAAEHELRKALADLTPPAPPPQEKP